mmetsp:Transcript_8224/g.22929  ORF Transcript_8224/g.22929 Transcript_8224/m.22929 type:complete len:306 (-) Transcript_8224:1765-2682(-)
MSMPTLPMRRTPSSSSPTDTSRTASNAPTSPPPSWSAPTARAPRTRRPSRSGAAPSSAGGAATATPSTASTRAGPMAPRTSPSRAHRAAPGTTPTMSAPTEKFRPVPKMLLPMRHWSHQMQLPPIARPDSPDCRPTPTVPPSMCATRASCKSPWTVLSAPCSTTIPSSASSGTANLFAPRVRWRPRRWKPSRRAPTVPEERRDSALPPTAWATTSASSVRSCLIRNAEPAFCSTSIRSNASAGTEDLCAEEALLVRRPGPKLPAMTMLPLLRMIPLPPPAPPSPRSQLRSPHRPRLLREVPVRRV